MNLKAFQLAISTIILFILGFLVLLGLAYIVTSGFKTFKSSTEPFTDTARSSSIKQACSLACEGNNKLTYCCDEFDIDDETIKCEDERLEISCNLECEDSFCNDQAGGAH